MADTKFQEFVDEEDQENDRHDQAQPKNYPNNDHQPHSPEDNRRIANINYNNDDGSQNQEFQPNNDQVV